MDLLHIVAELGLVASVLKLSWDVLTLEEQVEELKGEKMKAGPADPNKRNLFEAFAGSKSEESMKTL